MKKANTLAMTLVLMLFACSGNGLGDDSTADQVKVENVDLKNKNIALTDQYNDIFNDRQAILNKLKKTLQENAGLQDRLAAAPQKKQDKAASGPDHQKKMPDYRVLRKKLVETNMELAVTKNKEETLKQEVANMHYNLGTVLLEDQNKYNEAIREFEKDLMINPDDADAHYNLALIYDKGKNNRERAIGHYKAYLQIRPDAADALKVKERLTDLEAQQKIWKIPDPASIDEKQGLGRL